MNRLLITGGAGFIGSRLVRRLCKQGFSITVLDNYSKPGADDFSDISDRITVVRADIRDSETVNSALKNADAVIHLAAMVSVQESLKKPAECFAINVQATENIINECARRNIKFIFASSAAVYGNQEDAIVTERVTPRPISPYGESKLKVEEICKKTPKLNFVCLRQFNVYGPKQTINYAYASVVPQFLHAARTNKPLIIYGDGEQTRDFIHIDDIVNAYIKSIQSDVKGIFNVGTGTTCTINQLATLIIAATQSKSKVIKKKARDADIKRSQPSIKAFCEATQWRPTATIEHGIFALSLQADVSLPKSTHHPKQKMLIAMPAYNEGPVIGNVVSNLKANGYYDILVVDDCSKDDTSAQAKKADATVIRHVINRGAGAATATAISYARKNDYDFLVLMDADGQHSPADVEPLLLCAQSHDVVIGSRNIDDESMPLVRRIANRVGSIVTWFFFGKYVRDSQSGFKVFNKRALKTITITFDRFEFCSEIIGEINRNNLSVSEVPITVIYTEHSQSKGQSIVNGFKMIARFVLRS